MRNFTLSLTSISTYLIKARLSSSRILHLSALLALLLSGLQGWGQISEGFETGLTGSYQSGNVTLGSGTWTVTNVLAGTSNFHSGTKSAQLQSATGSALITPTLTGGVGTISFWIAASTTSGAYQVNISTDNGATFSPAPGSPFSITAANTTALKTIVVNNSSVNKIQIYRTGATIYVDDFSTTVAPVSATNYYLTANADPTIASNWGPNSDGTGNLGSNPASVGASNAIWNVSQNGSTTTSTWANAWTLGSGSSISLKAGNTFNVAGVLTMGGQQITAAGAGVSVVVTANGTIQTSNTAGFSGTTSTTISSSNNPTVTLNSASNVEYNGSSSQTVTSASTYGNLKFSGTATYTIPTALGTSAAAPFTLANGTLAISAGILNLTPNAAATSFIKVGVVSITGGQLDGLSTSPGVATNLLVAGSWSHTAGKVALTGAGYGQIIFTGGGSVTYAGLTSSSSFVYWGIQVSNNTTVTLNSNFSTNSGTHPADLKIDAGSTLIAGTNLITPSTTTPTITVNGTLKTANNAGLSGSASTTFTAGTGTLGSASIIEYNAASGTQVVTPRTDYANLIISGGGTKTVSGTAAVSVDFTIASGTFSIAAANLFSLKGTWTNSGTFTPNSSTVTFNGSSAQTYVRTGSGSFNNVTLNNSAGLTVNNDLTVSGTLTFTSGKITTGANQVIASGTVSGGGTGWVIGNLQKPISATGNKTFEIGGSSNYRPVSLNFTALTTGGSITASVTQADGTHPQIGSSLLDAARTVKRYFTLTNSGVDGTYDAVFNFVAADVPAGAIPANFIVGKYSGGWAYPTVGTKTATSTQITGSTTYGEFSIGESAVAVSLTANALAAFGPICISATDGPNTFTINGTNLSTANVDVAALPGFTYSTTSGGLYATSLSLSQPGGNYSQIIYVKFKPTDIQSYNGNIVISGGGAPASYNVAASGSGKNDPATVANTPTSTAITATTATLGGTIASSGCATIDEYGIYWSVNSGFAITDLGVTKVSTIGSTTGSFTKSVTGLPANTTVYFKAFAAYSGSISGTALSNQGSFVTLKAEPTAQPSSLVFSAVTTTSFSTGFTPASPAADGYIVVRSTGSSLSNTPVDGTTYTVGSSLGGGTVVSASATTSGIANSSLTAGTTYYTFVFAYNNSGAAIDYLTTSPLTSSVITLPIAPAPTSSNATPVSFDVSWSPVTGAASYQLQVATDAGFTSIVSGYNNITATSPASVTGLAANTQYYFRVRGANASGNGAYGSGNVTTLGLGAPIALAASNVSTSGFTANWNAVTGATGYRLDVSTSAAFSTGGELLNQSFTSPTFPPAGWLATNWTRSTSAADYNTSPAAVIAGATTGTLTMNAVANPTSISFYLGRSSNSTAKTLTIEVSTTSQTAGFSTVATFDHSNVPSSSYDQYNVDLSAYSAFNQVYIRFVKSSSTTSPWRLDDIIVEGGVSSILPGYENLAVGNVTSYPVSLPIGGTYYYRLRASSTNSTSANSNVIAVVAENPEATADFYTKADGNFSDFTNWEYNRYGAAPYAPATISPTSSNNITIRNAIVLDQNFTVASGKSFITSSMAVGDTFKIAPTYTLSSNGTIDFGSRAVTVQSSSAGDGSIGQVNTSFTGTNVTVERFIPQNTSRAWRLLSVPTYGGQSIKAAWQEGATAITENPKPGYGTIITSKLSSWQTNGFDAKSADFSLKTYNGGFAGVTSTLGDIATSSGYFMYIRGDRTVKPSSSTSTLSSTILRTTGSPYIGNHTITAIADIDNLVGNIYASPVDLRELTTDPNSKPTVTIWDSKLGGTYGLGAYRALSFDGTNYTVTPDYTGDGVGTISNIIQSGQAFFVSPVTDDVAVTFTESAKVSTASAFNVFDAPVTENTLTVNLFAVNSDDSLVLTDGTRNVFGEKYIPAFDRYDARKINNIGENFFIRRGDDRLIVDKSAPLSSKDTIYFGIERLHAKFYEFSINTTLLNAGPALAGFFEDSYTKERTALNMNGISKVRFAINTADAASTAVDRFRIVFTGNGVLAVTYTDIRAYQKDKAVAVEWKAENQKNISNYIIERSLNGTDFAQAGTQKPTGTADQTVEYQWLDNSPAAGNNFYRVTSVDINGIKNYSKVVKVAFGAAAGFSIYPNPVTNGNISLHFNGMTKGSYTVRVLSASGALLYTKQLTYNGGDEVQTLSLGRRLVPTGRYFLELVQPDQSRTTQPLVISSK